MATNRIGEPDDEFSFRELCAAAQRNDPTVTRVSMRNMYRASPEQMLALGAALQHNTNVSDVELSPRSLTAATSKAASYDIHPLLQWIQRSSALQKVEWFDHYKPNEHGDEDDDLGPIDVSPTVLQGVLRAVASNPSIRIFHSSRKLFPYPILAQYLTASRDALQSLELFLDEEVDDVAGMEEAAQAMQSLTRLEELELYGTGIDLFFQRLQSSPFPVSLRRLKLYAWGEAEQWIPLEVFSTALTSCAQMEHLRLDSVVVDLECWTLIESKLASTPSLTSLSLHDCYFSFGAGAMFLRYMQSSDTSRQHIRTLQLQECKSLSCRRPDESPNRAIAVAPVVARSLNAAQVPTVETGPNAISQMVCGSLVRHLEVSWATFSAESDFFNGLTANTSAVQLRSLKIEYMPSEALPQVSPYIATTVDLDHLTIQLDNLSNRVVNNDALMSFLAGLRRNSSLHRLDMLLASAYRGETVLNARMQRFVDAVLTRNRALPELVKMVFRNSRGDDRSSKNGDDSDPAVLEGTAVGAFAPLSNTTALSPAMFPTLGVSAMEASPRWSPNTVLRGLMAASNDVIGDLSGTARRGRDGKRKGGPQKESDAKECTRKKKYPSRKRFK